MKAKAKALPRLQGDWADATFPQFTLGGEPKLYDDVAAAEAAVKKYYDDNNLVTGPKVSMPDGQRKCRNGNSMKWKNVQYKYFYCSTPSHCGHKQPCPFVLRITAVWADSASAGDSPTHWKVMVG